MRTVLRILCAGLAWLVLSHAASSACGLATGEQQSEGETVPAIRLPIGFETHHAHADYFIGVLNLALEKTAAEYGGPCEVQRVPHAASGARLFRLLANKDGADILYASGSPERNRNFVQVSFPLVRGLSGYRVFFVRTADLEAFGGVSSLEELQHFSAGQGGDWPDLVPLRSNGLPVVTAHNKVSLFRMLRVGRFDYFPRGAHQILDEKLRYYTDHLSIEPRLMLVYPSPVFFYLNRDNEALATRVEKGLWMALEDGSFDDFFNNHELIRGVYENLHFDGREAIFICNPNYTELSLLKDPRLWVRPWPEDLCAD